MLKFEENRVKTYKVDSANFKNSIPLLCVSPKNKIKNPVVFIFNGGIGSSIPACLYMNNKVFDEHYFISYEKAGHNDNINKPSQYKKNYLLELEEVVNWVKTNLPNHKIFLLGESWGTSINLLYYKRNKEKVDGVFCWNNPFKIVNPEKKTKKQMYSIAWRELVTLLFNIECHLPVVQTSQEKFCHDPLFRRLLSIVPPSKRNTKINIAVWRFMKPAYRFICKYGKNSSYKFMYVQSGEDVMADWKTIKNIQNRTDKNHFSMIKTGYHVLSMEPKESIILYDKLLKFIQED